MSISNEEGTGQVNLRKTHPGLYRMSMIIAVACILVGINFIFLTPTFPVYGIAYAVWATVFIVLGASKVYLLSVHHDLRLVRVSMAMTVAFLVFFGIGTMQPWVQGEGSLQLPILYLTIAALEFPLLIEPFVNPWTAKSNGE